MDTAQIAAAIAKILASHDRIDGKEWCVYEPEGDDYIDITIYDGQEDCETRLTVGPA